MEESEFESYLKERYYDQVDWYDRKAARNQKVYKIFQWGLIILAAITPVLIVIDGDVDGVAWGRWGAVVVSCLVAIGTASLKVFKFQENWINYRTTCETLRKEIHYFKAGVNDYRGSDDPMGLFVKRVESLISRENTMWLSAQERNEDNS
jgi:hypothetical protein